MSHSAHSVIDEALAAALLAAPSCQTLIQTARNANEALGLDWSDAKWRGIWKSHPGEAFLVQKKLGEGLIRHVHGQKLFLTGDMKGATVSDAHAPYQDDRAIALASKVLKWWKPEVLVHAGDNIDCAAISKFDANPQRVYSIPEEVNAWQSRVYIPLMSAVGPKCRTFVLPGNHDLRQERWLWRHPEMFGLRELNLPALLGAKELGFEYVGYAVVVDNKLEISHGTRVSAQSGMSARAELLKRGYSISTSTGHVHRAGRHEYQAPYGPLVVAQENPCLCSLDPDYLTDPNWVAGLTLWSVFRGNLWIQAVTFNQDYTCMVDGRWFEA
jgi:predicted phosphodiesterase